MQRERFQTRPPVGSVEWERAGGPPLFFGQKIGALGGAGVVVLLHYGQRFWWQLSRRGILIGVLSGAHGRDLLAAEPHTHLIASVTDLPTLLAGS